MGAPAAATVIFSIVTVFGAFLDTVLSLDPFDDVLVTVLATTVVAAAAAALLRLGLFRDAEGVIRRFPAVGLEERALGDFALVTVFRCVRDFETGLLDLEGLLERDLLLKGDFEAAFGDFDLDEEEREGLFERLRDAFRDDIRELLFNHPLPY